MYHDRSELSAGAVSKASILECRCHCRDTTTSHCIWFADGFCHCLVGFIQRRYVDGTEELEHFVAPEEYAQRQREYISISISVSIERAKRM